MGRRQKRKATAEVDGTPSEETQTSVSSEQKRKKKGRTSTESTKKGGAKVPAKDPGDKGEAAEEAPGIVAVRAEDLKEGDPGTLTGRPMRLYTDGIFDLLHYGHMRAIEQVKKAFPNTYVMVGCCSDAVTHKYKGLTVMAEDERYESLRHCKWVDEVIEDGPWVVTPEFLEEHQIDYVCHDALPYVDTSGQSAGGDVYGDLKKMGKFYETQRTEGVSTSDVISRIIVRYDEYVTRQLKRGYTAKDLNISPIKETELFIKKFAKSTNKSLKEMQRNFVDAFDRNSQIRTRFRQQRKQTWDKINGRINELAKTSLC